VRICPAHVGVFPRTTLGDQKSEFKEISKFMNEIYAGISSAADDTFRKSVQEMIKSHETKIHCSAPVLKDLSEENY
jgi:glycine/serine hydroxymethyltransferase